MYVHICVCDVYARVTDQPRSAALAFEESEMVESAYLRVIVSVGVIMAGWRWLSI